MTTLTNQENTINISNTDNNKIDDKEKEQNKTLAQNSKFHTFLANISNKLGLSNAVYFK